MVIEQVCTVRQHADSVRTLSKSMVRTLRQLKRAVAEGCPTCPRFEGCLVLESLNAQVSQALDDVADAWNLDAVHGPRHE